MPIDENGDEYEVIASGICPVMLVICDHAIMLGCKECHHGEKHTHSSECDFICPVLSGMSICVDVD